MNRRTRFRLAATTVLAIIAQALVLHVQLGAPLTAVIPAGGGACVFASDGDTRRYRARRRSSADL